MVVYGHTPVPEPEWLNNTINIDTGCVFGGRLTALRYPEQELVSVPAARVYYAGRLARSSPGPRRLRRRAPPTRSEQDDAVLRLGDVLGQADRDALHRRVTIREENATAALEVISRFAPTPSG